MQFSSLIHATAVAFSLAGALAAAGIAYADAPSASPQKGVTQQALAYGSAQAPAAASNTGPYDSPDFVVPESEIFS
jgi:hypothetical protein